MIALFRLSTISELGMRTPITEWSDDIDGLLENTQHVNREDLRVERIVGERELAEIPEEVWQEVDSKNEDADSNGE